MPSSKDLSSSAMLSPPSVTLLPSTPPGWAKCSIVTATLLLLTLSTVGCTLLTALAENAKTVSSNPTVQVTTEAVKTVTDALVPIPLSGTIAKGIVLLGIAALLTLTQGGKKK